MGAVEIIASAAPASLFVVLACLWFRRLFTASAMSLAVEI